MKQLKRHLSVANVLSGIALFVALSGAAYAAALAPKSVKTKNLANGAVTARKLHKAAVTTPKIAREAVIAAKIAQGNVGTTQLSDGGVRSADLGGGVVTTQKLKDGAVTSAKMSSSFLSQFVKNVSYVTGSTGSEATDAVKSVTAECTPSAAQKQAIGGGAAIVSADKKEIRLIESGPTFKGGTAVGWTAAAIDEGSPSTEWTLQVYAICAEL